MSEQSTTKSLGGFGQPLPAAGTPAAKSPSTGAPSTGTPSTGTLGETNAVLESASLGSVDSPAARGPKGPSRPGGFLSNPVAPSSKSSRAERAATGGGGRRDLFYYLDGWVSNLMIVFGLMAVLAALAVPGCQAALRENSQARWQSAELLVMTELEAYRRTQDEERQREQQEIASGANPALAGQVAGREAARQTNYRTERARLERTHRLEAKRRAAFAVPEQFRWGWMVGILGWIGRVLLLLGLTITTSQAQGARQWAFAVLTAVALLASLSGFAMSGSGAEATGPPTSAPPITGALPD